jgi:hypothetical protein
MRKLAVPVVGIAALGVAVAAAPSGAQDPPPVTTVTAKAKVTPDKPGTKKKPRGVKLKVDVHWETPGDVEKPVVQRATVMFPKGSLYNGAKFPKCSANTMSRKGINGCPKGSIMGKGSGVAFADTVLTYPKITVVNGGKSSVFLWTVMTNPARVQAPVPGKITKASGKWAYKLELTVPQSLQIVAGVPIALRDFTVTAGKKDWLATTGCPEGEWPFEGETFFDNGSSGKFASSVDCG